MGARRDHRAQPAFPNQAKAAPLAGNDKVWRSRQRRERLKFAWRLLVRVQRSA